MKSLIVLACLFAVAFANEDANVIKNESEVNIDGFKYILELDNHIRALQQGELKDKDTLRVSGEFEWISKEGKHIKVVYTADEYGYHPKVESLN